MIDLVCLVADKNMEAVVQGLLAKHNALGIRPVDSQIIVHPQHDPGCFKSPEPYLGLFAQQAATRSSCSIAVGMAFPSEVPSNSKPMWTPGSRASVLTGGSPS